MEEALDQYLTKRYSTIFQNRHASVAQSCMAWGFSCGDGWFNILDGLCAAIEGHMRHLEEENDRTQRYLDKIAKNEKVPEWIEKQHKEGKLLVKKVPQFVAEQVKEKFGTLRFYYRGGDDYIGGLVSFAEQMSAVTCEVCGKPGSLTGRGWVRTRCEEHSESKPEKIEIKVGDEVNVVKLGEVIEMEVLEVVSPEEIRGKRIFDSVWDEEERQSKEYEGEDEFYVAKMVKNPFIEYWDAEKV